MIAMLGAAAGLGGLTLVFLGLLITVLGGLSADVPASVRLRYQWPASLAAAAFAASLACVTLAAIWLVGNQWDGLYEATSSLFFAQLVLVVFTAGVALVRLLRV